MPRWASCRAASWPAAEDPGGRTPNSATGTPSPVSWLRQCANGVVHLDADSYPPAVSLRLAADWPDRAVVTTDLAQVRAVIDRIAAEVDELARAHRVQDLTTTAVLSDPRGGRGRTLPAAGAGLGRLAGRARPARQDQPTARLRR